MLIRQKSAKETSEIAAIQTTDSVFTGCVAKINAAMSAAIGEPFVL